MRIMNCSIPNCVPEYNRSRFEDEAHEAEKEWERLTWYEKNKAYRRQKYIEGCNELQFYPPECEKCPHGEEAMPDLFPAEASEPEKDEQPVIDSEPRRKDLFSKFSDRKLMKGLTGLEELDIVRSWITREDFEAQKDSVTPNSAFYLKLLCDGMSIEEDGELTDEEFGHMSEEMDSYDLSDEE